MSPVLEAVKTSRVIAKWNAKDYHENSSIQFEAANNLLSKICLNGHESILDIGCGDGKITALISEHLPRGKILGIDLSPEMIHFAQMKFPRSEYPNLAFYVEDGAKIDYHNEFDLVFSSFALQWIVQSDFFMEKIKRTLKKNGKLVATMPLGISKELEEASQEMINHPNWSEYFVDYSAPQRFDSADKEYAKMLISSGFKIIHFKTISHIKKFDSREQFEDYVFQWYPYILYIPSDLKCLFFKEVIDKYLKLKPQSTSGQVSFEFPRIEIIAKK